MKRFLLTLPLLVAVAYAACSPSTPRCLASNCNGCCDVNGSCQVGTERFACGAHAGMCSSCTQTEDCVQGACTPGDGGTSGTGGGGAGGACGPSTCAGCCANDGRCLGGNTNGDCGARGAACSICPTGQSCQYLDAGTFACATFVCTGCRSTTGNCLLGNSQGACGSDGGMCTACLSGQSCMSGACVTATTCGPSNCAGCCDGTLCVDPPTTPKCGRSGAACTGCTGSDVCNAGVCGPQMGGTGGGSGAGGGSGSGCGPQTCASGCCDPAFNLCLPGTDDLLCGKGGATCDVCLTLIGLHCKLQTCAF